MKKRGIFICFTGIDGAGKTTLAMSLTEYLRDRGIKTIYVYNRYVPIILKPIISIGDFLFLHDKNIFKDYHDYSDSKKDISKKYPFLAKCYQNILLADYFFQIFFKIRLPLLLGKNVVCDRYIYDTIITDLSIDFNYSREDVRKLLCCMLSFFPTPHITFLIDLPENIAFSRKNDIPSIDYLRDRRYMYLYMGKEQRMKIIDGSLSLEDVKYMVKKNIDDVIR